MKKVRGCVRVDCRSEFIMSSAVCVTFKYGDVPDAEQSVFDSQAKIEEGLAFLSGGFESLMRCETFNVNLLPDPASLNRLLTHNHSSGKNGFYIHAANGQRDPFFGSGLGKTWSMLERIKFDVRTSHMLCHQTVAVIRGSELFARYKQVCRDGTRHLIKELASVNLLAIDDIGCEMSQGFVGFLGDLLMEREGPTYFTSQYTLEAFVSRLVSTVNADELPAVGRLMRRMLDFLAPIPFDRPDEGRRLEALGLMKATDKGGYTLFKAAKVVVDGGGHRVEKPMTYSFLGMGVRSDHEDYIYEVAP
jgi:hypothetical protein